MSESDTDLATMIGELLEAYIVDTLSTTPSEREPAFAERAATVLGEVGDWRVALHTHLRLPADFDAAVRDAYAHQRESTDDGGFDLSPEHFARAFVMHNFRPADDSAP